MDRPTAPTRVRSLRTCIAGLAGAAVVAGVLAPVAASAQEAPTATPTATPSGSASASPSAAPVSARPVLAAPALVGPVAPTDQPQSVLKDVVLSWKGVPAALGYRVQVSQDGDFSSDEVTLDVDTVATRLALPTALPHAAYRWRVAAKQTAGHGFWSASGAFTKGWRDRVTGLRMTQGADTDGDGAADEFPTFAWDPVAGASEYELQVSKTSTFAQVLDPTRAQAGFETTACFTTRTRVTGHNTQAQAKNDGAGDCDFSNIQADEFRYWRVRPLDHVVDDVPAADTTPVVDNGVLFQPLGAKSDTVDTSACPKPEGAATPSASPSAAPTASASAAPEAGGLSCDPAHTVQKGAWSEVKTIVLTRRSRAATPTAQTLLPVDVKPLAQEHCTERPAVDGEGRMSDCVEFPTLDWEPRAGALGYRLYIALDDAYTNIQEIVETYASEWTPTVAWRDSTASQTYYYAVQACTVDRCGLVTPVPDSFRKKNVRTELTSPAADALFGPTDVVLRWKPFSTSQRTALAARVAGTPQASEAYAYRVQVATAPDDGRTPTDADFQSPVEDVVVDGTLCRPGTIAAGAVVDPRTTQRAVQSCDTTGGYAVHDATRDEVSYTSADLAYPTGSYVWRVQALDASGHSTPWSTVSSFRRDATPPTASVSGSPRIDTPLTVRFSEPVRGVTTSTLTITPAAATTLALSADGRTATVRPVRTWTPGQSYTLALTAGITDAVGNALAPLSGTAAMAKLVDDGSKALAYSTGWGMRRASNAVGGSFRTSFPTMRAQTAATVTLAGKGAVVTGCVGPAGGMMDVWVDGAKRGRIDTYRSYSGCGVRLARLALADGVHRVQVRGVGVKRPASKGTSVMLDAITAL